MEREKEWERERKELKQETSRAQSTREVCGIFYTQLRINIFKIIVVLTSLCYFAVVDSDAAVSSTGRAGAKVADYQRSLSRGCENGRTGERARTTADSVTAPLAGERARGGRDEAGGREEGEGGEGREGEARRRAGRGRETEEDGRGECSTASGSLQLLPISVHS